jgi:hypothetical protein
MFSTSVTQGVKYSLSQAPKVSFFQKEKSKNPSFETLNDKLTFYTNVDSVLQIDLNQDLPLPSMDVEILVFDFQQGIFISNAFHYGKKTKRTIEKNQTSPFSMAFKFICKNLQPFDSLYLIVTFKTKEEGIIFQSHSQEIFVLAKRTPQCIKRKSPQASPFHQPTAKVTKYNQESELYGNDAENILNLIELLLHSKSKDFSLFESIEL